MGNSQIEVALTYLKFVGEVVALLGFVGTVMVFCAKGILAFGDLRHSIKTAIGFMERFELKFDEAQEEVRMNYKEFRDCFSEHNEQFAKHDSRLKTVEFVLDLDHRAQNYIDTVSRAEQNNRRTHVPRRTQDQVNQDVRDMIDLNQDDDA